MQNFHSMPNSDFQIEKMVPSLGASRNWDLPSFVSTEIINLVPSCADIYIFLYFDASADGFD